MKRLNRQKYILLLLIVVSIMTIGFAVLSSSLSINGTSTINSNTWDVHFENIVVSEGNNVTGTQSITSSNTLTTSVSLTKPGDYYSFVVDVVNEGSIDAMLNSFTKTELTGTNATLLDFNVTYADGVEIQQYDKLAKTSGIETIKVEVIYSTDVTASDLPTSALNVTLNVGMEYVQATSSANTVTHTDLGNFIIKAKRGAAESTDVGTTFTVNLGSTYGDHTLRVANVSTPTECSEDDFSGTACGVVLEFADIITTHNMNPSGTYKGTTYSYGWNVDGWPASSMRTFVNDDIYNALPTMLQNAAINTTVISGHGSTSGETNFTSTDKLYLLSAHEVWADGSSNAVSSYDTSYSNTRQLDYYAGLGVTTSSYSGAIKQNAGSNSWWWLRSASSNYTTRFLSVYSYGDWSNDIAHDSSGVSPAFRIA